MPRILILEDERVVARDLGTVLATIGYETSMDASGEEAIEVARRAQPDLALVDIHLAGTLDGIETAQALREELDLAVVYLTAHSDDHTLERAKATEPCGYLVKPFDGTTLQTTLQMAVHKSIIERRRRTEHRWQTSVLDQLTVGIITADTAGKVSMINARGQSLTGLQEREALGREFGEVLTLYSDKNVNITAELLDGALRGQEGHSQEGCASLISKSGTETCVEYRVSPVQDERHQVVGGSLVFWPVESAGPERARPSTGASEADVDPATGLPGRAHAITEIRVAREKQPGLFAVLFVVDHYYLIARKYGAKAADELLTYYAMFLAQQIPDCKGLFRWTGPCFVAIIGPLECLQFAQRLISRTTHASLHPPFQPGGTTAMVTISGSAEVYAIDGKPLDVLVSLIDSSVAIQTKSQQH